MRYALRVVVLDAAAAHIVGPARAGALASAPAASTTTADGLVAADAEAEENGGDEQGCPGAPTEPKGVLANVGSTAVSLEGIAGLDKGGAI